MIIQKRIINPSNYLAGILDDEKFMIGVKIADVPFEQLKKIGFTEDLINGLEVLPTILGPRSRYNANGGFVRHKDKPKELCYRTGYITDWHGNEHIIEIPYRRYPRTPTLAPNIHITISELNNERYIISPILVNSNKTKVINKHIINLFLELFSFCEVYNDDLSPALLGIPIQRVNWRILPAGENIWDKVNGYIGNIPRTKEKGRKLLSNRAKHICKFAPDNIYVGHGGFYGYLIYEFKRKDIFVVDSVIYGQATYILGNDWGSISKFSKSEIINNDLHKDRIIHTSGWEDSIETIVK